MDSSILHVPGFLALGGVIATGAAQVIIAFVQRPKEKKLAETQADQRYVELVTYVKTELNAASQKFLALKQQQGSLPTIPDFEDIEQKLEMMGKQLVDATTRVAVLEKELEHERVQRDLDRKTNLEIQLDLREVLTTVKMMQPKGR